VEGVFHLLYNLMIPIAIGRWID